ncbi:hypothetical protein Tco_1058762 [Tanacetum coccineum]|uniref:Retrotransposon gag domain-containing protein n=1 Tax=Tanacetum coccineum TaxID=301880 RepID=A0ABQ5HAT2_9ASTR
MDGGVLRLHCDIGLGPQWLAFSPWALANYPNVVDHIAKVLEMVDLIYIPGVDSHQVRMKVFHLSLGDNAKEWWIREGDGKITTWEEFVEKFFCRFYPESYNREDEILDEGDN